MPTQRTNDDEQARQVIRIQEPITPPISPPISPPRPDPTPGSPPDPAARPTGGSARAVLDRLAALAVGEPVAHERMTLFPLLAPTSPASPLRYRTLEQALADGSVEVTEQPSATVPELLLRNKGATMVLILDGEEIVGGRQNRVVNASFLVAAGATIKLPVTCVEHGRWHPTAPRFSSGESTFFSLKREKFAQVSASLRAAGTPVSDQGAVWSSVAAKAMRAGASSPTGAMHEVYQASRPSLDEYLRAFPSIAGAVGFAVALGGRMAGADLFDQPATAEALWPKLVRSYALDALDSPAGAPPARERAVRLLERTRGARCETYASLALGEDVRLTGDGAVGGALVYQETPVHISLFRTLEDAPAAQTSTMTRASARRTFIQRKGIE